MSSKGLILHDFSTKHLVSEMFNGNENKLVTNISRNILNMLQFVSILLCNDMILTWLHRSDCKFSNDIAAMQLPAFSDNKRYFNMQSHVHFYVQHFPELQKLGNFEDT